MLPKAHRLANTKAVSTVLARGRAFFSPYLTIKFVRTQSQSRYTVVVSTKVSKLAVTRNRIKRVLRDEIQKLLPRLSSTDCIIMVKPKTVSLTGALLRVELRELLTKAKLLVTS